MRAVLAGLMLVGCASASSPDNTTVTIGTGTDAGHHIDADENNPIDGPPAHPIDAPPVTIDGPPAPQEVTFTQTTDNTIAAAMSVTCSNNTTGESRANSWIRVFKLSDFNVTTDFTVEHADFAAQEASGASVQVTVGTYAGFADDQATLSRASMTPISTKTVAATADNQPLSASFTGVTIPAGGSVYVEIAAPDYNGTGKYFYVGTTADGQLHDGYIESSVCSVTPPKKIQAVAAGAGSLILTVTGTH